MQSITITTPAASPPVSTADLRTHLHLNDTSEDALLAAWVLAASDLFTRTTGYVLMTTTFKMYLDGWPCGHVFIPRTPVTSVTSTEYLDTSGVWQTLSGTSSDINGTPARIILPTSLPSLHATTLPNVRVTFVAGNASAAACPPLALTGIKLLASHWYGSREAFGEANLNEVPAGWRAICGMFNTGMQGVWNEQ